ncbi:arsenate reductase/protein-tyrosine-phosphatase family protein [Micromonospora deserti]|uniref:ArsR family transcriptional regulator n=1 Tax=Micromonospora deserti TaxID=2070366 RepID=A0A2W2DT80_9ACTN|nr:ArsR family transcriptional regulator [Micromonospora deserti]PZG02948.1 ArsR family transcriptional regulator [Micromonospora deserti]
MGSSSQAAPTFVRLAGHPLRWQLLTELAHGDLRVRELVALVDQPQNLVSYHLRLLRDGGLVRAIRSSFDGRDSYYHLDLDRCAEALTGACAALHPALRLNQTAPAAPARRRRLPRLAVLFVCTGNSARSPIAEALLRHHTAGHVTAISAGSHPKPRLHPNTVRVLADRFGIDVTSQRPRHLDTLTDRRFDYVITLCDKAREVCPEFGDHPRQLHWSIPDPATVGTSDHASYPAFTHTAADIDTRVRHLLPALAPPTQSQPKEVKPCPPTSTPASATSSTTCRPPSTSTPDTSASA